MMLWILAGWVILTSTSHAQTCPSLPSAASYKLKQKFFTFGSDFSLTTSGGSPAGHITEKLFRWGTTFELTNPEGLLVATARRHVFSFGTKIDVTDCFGRPIGRLQEKIVQSLLGVVTFYSIRDPAKRVIGRSRKLDLFSTDFVFYDDSSRVVAEAHRPWINVFTEKWTVTIEPSSAVDPRLMLFAPAFKTASDHAKAVSRALDELNDSRSDEDDRNRRESSP